MIYFRADGNSEIASGHLMRCCSVAKACLEKSHNDLSVCFLVSNRESRDMLAHFLPATDLSSHTDFCCNQILIRILEGSDYRNPETELPLLIGILKEDADNASSACEITKASGRKPILFLDSYFVTPSYLEVLNSYVQIAYIDDLQLFDYPVEWVINYDVLSDEMVSAYEKKYSLAQHRLLGPEFAPLREQFICERRMNQHLTPVDRSISSMDEFHILISSGGSDPAHTCLHMLRYFLENADLKHMGKQFPSDTARENVLSEKLLHFHILVGSANPDKALLASLAQADSRITLHENVTDMASLMTSCDIAFSAAGTTLYELCALGIPSASFVLADNQLASAKAFEQAGAVPCLGDVRAEEATVFSGACTFLKSMLSDSALRKKAATRMQQLTDGRGAYRIAETIMSEYFIT